MHTQKQLLDGIVWLLFIGGLVGFCFAYFAAIVAFNLRLRRTKRIADE